MRGFFAKFGLEGFQSRVSEYPGDVLHFDVTDAGELGSERSQGLEVPEADVEADGYVVLSDRWLVGILVMVESVAGG